MISCCLIKLFISLDLEEFQISRLSRQSYLNIGFMSFKITLMYFRNEPSIGSDCGKGPKELGPNRFLFYGEAPCFSEAAS